MTTDTKLVYSTDQGTHVHLSSPTAMPKASAFLWNRQMMIQVNCRGYAVAQFMQPEPAKYAYAPNLEAKTFMQPEQPYYAHHPGRFFYVKDEQNGQLFSAPYEPVRAQLQRYDFCAGTSDIRWQICGDGIELDMILSLAEDDVVELWEVRLRNTSQSPRKLSLYPYFPVGYMSWMNQSGVYRPELNAVVCSCVTPYQKVADWFKTIKHLKDKTCLLADREPTAWDVRQEAFEGEGGLHNPSAIQQTELSGSEAIYETPTAALQYRLHMEPGEEQVFRFVFGPAKDDVDIKSIRQRYFSNPQQFQDARERYAAYVQQGRGCLHIGTPDQHLNDFVNHWLPRQVFYHGDVNRLTTDPQTRNYLQDNMGMAYIAPPVARAAFIQALSQQNTNGAMPDGILLRQDAELKYINQVPHTDHCVWIPVCLRAYLDETNDRALLQEQLAFADDDTAASVAEHIDRAMEWLLTARDERGLSYIGQGDWCDPMNMVGYKGRGVSGWLTLATAYALNLWADICRENGRQTQAEHFKNAAHDVNAIANQYFWDGHWYARGITDDDVKFGISKDQEGRIFLNPQSWSLLSGAADEQRQQALIQAVEEQLETPYGPMMFAPAYTAMREDVGRVTQKFPGAAENGSVYNHAAAFYIFSLLTIGESDRAYRLLRQMVTGPTDDDYQQRGQLPVFIPNYYRGAYYQFPRTAGRSSQLFNTGTVAWIYRSMIEGVFGLKGEGEGLRIAPQLPSAWPGAKATRYFRGATLQVEIKRQADIDNPKITVDGESLPGNHLEEVETGKTYHIEVLLPPDSASP